MLRAATYKNTEYLTKARSMCESVRLFLRSLGLPLALVAFRRLLGSYSVPSNGAAPLPCRWRLRARLWQE